MQEEKSEGKRQDFSKILRQILGINAFKLLPRAEDVHVAFCIIYDYI